MKNDLLNELSDLYLKAKTIKENCRGPKKHHVFMAMTDAVDYIKMAVYHEENRIGQLAIDIK